MSNLCTIKASSHGIQLLLDDKVDFETLVTDICRQFAESREFFGPAEIILEVTGRTLSMEELRVITQAIELNSDVRVRLLSDSDPDSGKRALFDIEEYFTRQRKEKVHFIPDDVHQGQSLAYDMSVVVMGDIKKGASLAAAGNVIIMGDLMGSVAAGGSTDTSCYVAVAGEVLSTEVSVGGITGEFEPEEEAPRGFFRKKEKKHDVSCFVIYDKRLVKEPMREGIISHVS